MASCTWPLRHFIRRLTERRSALWECSRERCSVRSWRKVWKKTRPQEHSWESIAALPTVLPEEHLLSWCWAASFELGCLCSSRIYARREEEQLAKPVRPTKFSNGDHVFIRNYGVNGRVKWVPGRVTSSVGTRMFNVQCADGVHRRHVDQMRQRVKVLPTYSQPPVDEFRFPVATRSATQTPGSPRCETPTRDVQLAAPNVASPVLRRSTRDRHAPNTYSP